MAADGDCEMWNTTDVEVVLCRASNRLLSPRRRRHHRTRTRMIELVLFLCECVFVVTAGQRRAENASLSARLQRSEDARCRSSKRVDPRSASPSRTTELLLSVPFFPGGLCRRRRIARLECLRQ